MTDIAKLRELAERLRIAPGVVGMMAQVPNSTLDAAATTMISAATKLEDARAVLKEHHNWHLHAGPIGLPDGDGGWIEIDNGAEYSDSAMFERTEAALAGTPPDEAQVMPRGGISAYWWQVGILERRKRKAAEAELEDARAQVEQLRVLINSPELDDFDRGVQLEAAHQVERWGEAHDRSKSAENWYWLVGYLAGKALRAAITGDREKALHHTISAAAALRNWHAAIRRDETGAGVGEDRDLKNVEAAE